VPQYVGDEEPPGVSTVNKAPQEGQTGVRIINIELVIPELTSKLTWDIRLQIAGIPAPVHQMRWPDANQPFKDPSTQRCLPISHILEFFSIAHITDIREAPEETSDIVQTQQLADRDHISP